MKKGILILGAVLLFGFTPGERLKENSNSEPVLNNDALIEEIALLNGIIEAKLEKAEMFEAQAIAILAKDNTSEKGLNLVQEAKLQRMMTLKYKAAIACRTQSL